MLLPLCRRSLLQGLLHGDWNVGWISADTHPPMGAEHTLHNAMWQSEAHGWLRSSSGLIWVPTMALLCCWAWGKKRTTTLSFSLVKRLAWSHRQLKGRTGNWALSSQMIQCVDLHHPPAMQSVAWGPAVLTSPESFKEMENFSLFPDLWTQNLHFDRITRRSL